MEDVLGGCLLHYEYLKSDNQYAPTLLLLHGWGCDHTIFSCFENSFSEHTSLLSVDFPGHGKSAEPAQPWGVPEYAGQIVELLKSLSIQQVDIIAHSFGCRVAVYLASHCPELVHQMVLTGAAGIRNPVSTAKTKRQREYQRLKKFFLQVKKLPLLSAFADNMQEKLVQKYGSPDYRALSLNMRKTFIKVIEQDLSEYLPLIQQPTLLIWGSNDTETPLWMGEKMERLMSDAGLVLFDGGSHFAFLEQKERFLIIVKKFLWGGHSV